MYNFLKLFYFVLLLDNHRWAHPHQPNSLKDRFQVLPFENLIGLRLPKLSLEQAQSNPHLLRHEKKKKTYDDIVLFAYHGINEINFYHLLILPPKHISTYAMKVE